MGARKISSKAGRKARWGQRKPSTIHWPASVYDEIQARIDQSGESLSEYVVLQMAALLEIDLPEPHRSDQPVLPMQLSA
jgi:hypothetical protein